METYENALPMRPQGEGASGAVRNSASAASDSEQRVCGSRVIEMPAEDFTAHGGMGFEYGAGRVNAASARRMHVLREEIGDAPLTGIERRWAYRFFKRAFDSHILAERFTDHITSLSWGDDEGLIVLLNASEAEIEGCMYSLYMVGDEPDMLIVDSPLDIDMLKRLDVDEVYHVGDMSGSTRAMLRRSGIDFMELDGGDIIRFEDGKTRVITGDGPAHDGVFVTCPTCGTVIYVPVP